MDLNNLLKAGMRECGRVLKLLPTDEIKSPTEYMMTIIREETLPSLDILHPMIIKKTFSTADLIPVEVNDPTVLDSRIPRKMILDDRYSKYRIPLELTDGHEIMTIKSCVPISSNYGPMMDGFGRYGSYCGLPWNTHFGRATSGDLYGATLLSQVNYADRQLVGEISRNFRFYFYPPNILMVTNYIGPLNASFCVKNDENLISLDDMTYEGVKRLFILDLKKSIYNEFGNYTEIDTPYGTLDLRIQDWSSAEQERNELYDTYRSTSHFRTSTIRS